MLHLSILGIFRWGIIWIRHGEIAKEATR